ncbi:hypothetical protein VZT92_005503 [Zoarces viviparus]|uniref:Protein kinase domain-containing protein n=1 Tax=Zoarces viviparus TaxID=48416 RepID=A0AAW1FTH4_ZOAVI
MEIQLSGLLMEYYLPAPIVKIHLSGLLMKDYLPASITKIQLSGLLMKDYLPAPIMKIQLSGLLVKDYLPAPIMKIQLSGLLVKDYLPAPIMEIQLSGLLVKDYLPAPIMKFQLSGLLMKDYLPAPIMDIQLSGLLMDYYLPAPIMKFQLSGLLMKDYLPAPIMDIQLSGLLMDYYLPAPIMKIQLSGVLMKDYLPAPIVNIQLPGLLVKDYLPAPIMEIQLSALTPEVQAGQTLFGSSSGYSVLEFIGEGCYGKVAKCRNLATKESVAVKILKQDVDFIPDTEKEVSILEVISVLNPDHTNMVKFFERFEHMGQTCLAFEMLDRSLYDLLYERDWKPLALNKIGIIAKQLLVALDALKGLGILHTDIKPDNIMFVNIQEQPFKIKLIDFGEAIPASKVQLGMGLQPTGFRAPEVALGLPITEAIDVWGVGCVLAFLYLADHLFSTKCDYQMIKCMIEVLGQPEYHLLRLGIYTQHFFIEEEAADRPTWRLMMPEEYEAANHVKAEEQQSFIDFPSSLDDLVNIYPKGEAAEFEDRKAFVDLIKQLLHLDGDQRISPHRALQNPFITKSHVSEHTDSCFTECCTSSRLNTSGTMISVCPMEASADRDYLPAPIMEIQLSGLLVKDYLPAPIMEIQPPGLLM